MGLLSAGPRYSVKRVLFTVLLSALPLCLALFFMEKRLAETPVTGIVQSGILPTQYLAEVLDLSIDHPTFLSEIDLKEAERKLLATHVIAKATVKKMQPSHLLIDYTVRTPIAILGNYTNTGIDADGVLFPLLPAYLPKHLPEVILNVPNPPWGSKVTFDQSLLKEEVLQLDLTHPREVILKMASGDLVRLEKSTQQLPLYYKLREKILKCPSIVDLRLSECAFIQEIHE